MSEKSKMLANPETSITPQPQFNKSSISELQSMKNQVIEDMYSTDNENHRETLFRIVDRLENRQIDIAENHYWTNGSLPDEPIIYFTPKPEIRNEDSLGIKIEEWNDLEIIIGMDKVTFRKISSNTTKELFLTSMNWNNKSIKMDVIRLLAIGTIRKSDFIVNYAKTHKANPYETPEHQSIKNAISDLRNDLYGLFPSLKGVDPIEYNKRDKYWSTPIKITNVDSEQKALGLKNKMEDSSVDNRRPDYEDDRIETATYDKYEVYHAE